MNVFFSQCLFLFLCYPAFCLQIRKDLRVENILGDHNDAKQLFPNAVGIDSSAYPHTPLIDKKRPFPTKPKDRSRPKTPSSAKNHVPTSVGAIVHDSARPDKPLPDKYNGSAPRERSSSRDGQQTSRRYSAESLPNQSVSPIKPSHNTKPGANSYNDRSNHDRQNQKSQPTSASIPGISDESPVRKHPKPPSKPPPQQKGGNIVCDDKKPKVKAEDKTNQKVDNTFHMPPTISNNKRLPLKIKIEVSAFSMSPCLEVYRSVYCELDNLFHMKDAGEVDRFAKLSKI